MFFFSEGDHGVRFHLVPVVIRTAALDSPGRFYGGSLKKELRVRIEIRITRVLVFARNK